MMSWTLEEQQYNIRIYDALLPALRRIKKPESSAKYMGLQMF